MTTETPAEVLADIRRRIGNLPSGLRDDLTHKIDRLSRALSAGRVEVDPCGGCGETNPDKRCLGCRHVFFKTPQPKAWMHPDGRVISDKEKSEMLRSEIESISGVASRFTIPLGPITAPPADPAKASEPDLHAHLLDMLGVKTHEEAGAEIGRLHGIAFAKTKRARVQGYHGETIPWEVHGLAWETYAKKYGSGQSAQRIHERGGFGTCELDTFLPDWRERVSKIDNPPAKASAPEVTEALMWLRSALDCPSFAWDADQRVAAEAALTAALQEKSP